MRNLCAARTLPESGRYWDGAVRQKKEKNILKINSEA